MKPNRRVLRIAVFFMLQLFILWSCKNDKEAPPFPQDEFEYQQPETKTFEFAKGDTLQWNDDKKDFDFTSRVTKFNWDKLPSTPFDIGKPVQLKDSFPSVPFDWNSLSSQAFDYDNLPKSNLDVRVKPLGAPRVVKAGLPENATDATRGVMTYDGEFGYNGNIEYHIQDKDGFIWFAGGAGIARYDGENLFIYDREQGLNSRIIKVMLLDKQGRIWMGDDQGDISIVDPKNKLIYELNHILEPSQIIDMLETEDGKFWLSRWNNGYMIIDLKETSLWQFTPEQGLSGAFSISILQDHQGFIWLTTNKGINIIDLKNNLNFSLSTADGLQKEFVYTLFEDSANNIWINQNLGSCILNADRNTMTYTSEALNLQEGNAITYVFEDSKGDLWLGAKDGRVFRYDPQAHTMEEFFIKRNDQEVFVYGITEDIQGQIWISTLADGIFVINTKDGRPGNFDVSDGLHSNDIWTTLEAEDGKLWIGSSVGINVLDPKTNTLKHLGVEQGLLASRATGLMEDSQGRIWVTGFNSGVSLIDPNKQTIQQFKTFEELNDNWITAILEDDKGDFWLGGHLGELFYVDLKKDEIKSVYLDTLGTDNVIFDLKIGPENKLWASGYSIGIHVIDLDLKNHLILDIEKGLPTDDVFAAFLDDEDNFWYGTSKGVLLIKPKDMSLTTFDVNNGLASNEVYVILKRDEEMYFGTSKGINILSSYNSPENDDLLWKTKVLGKRQGLNFLDVNQGSFSIDSDGRFWAALDSQILTVLEEIESDTIVAAPFITGINIFDKKQHFKASSKGSTQMFEGDSVRSSNSNIDQLKSETETHLKAENDNKLEWSSISGPYDLPENLALPFDQNYLSFNYNSVQFKSNDKLVYRYILEGIDKTWGAITDKTTSENYRDLPPGNYTFKVAAKGFDEVWSAPSEFSFSISPPWWQTWWAYTIFVVLFLGLGLVILHYRSRWLKKENRILEERVEHRTAQLKKTIDELESTQSQLIQSEKMASLGELTAGIAHEIQNPMNFINNFSEVSIELLDEMCEELDRGEIEEAKDLSKDIIENLQKITHHGKRASSIVKGMLEHSRNSSGQKELIDINVLADEYLRLAYHGLRAKDKSFNADFKTDLDESLPKVEIIPQDLGRVVLNIINNAFFAVTSYEEDKKPENYKPLVTVTTKNMGDQVMISIKDNGPGIPKEIRDKIFQPFFTTKPTGKGTGLGLSLAYDIVTTGHGGAIELKTEKGEGTEFLIYIPIGNL